MSECLATIRKHVEVCAYKVLCASVSATNDPDDESWYPAFLDEEREIDKQYAAAVAIAAQNNQPLDKNVPQTIPKRGGKPQPGKRDPSVDEENFILHCNDLDMQAFMKVFIHRDAYRAKVLETFRISDEEAFTKACQRLASYRNRKFAHIPVKATEKELSELTEAEEQKIISDCDADIRMFFDFLRFFPTFNGDAKNAEKKSYYDISYELWCEAKRVLRIEELEIESFIQRNKLAIDVPTLIKICKDCGITVVVTDDKPYLLTTDYKKTLKTIRAMEQILVQKNEQMQSKEEIEKQLEEARIAAQSTQSKMETELAKTQAAATSNRKQMKTIAWLCALFIGILVIFLVILLSRGDSGSADKNDGKKPSTNKPQTSESQQASGNTDGDTDEDTPPYTGPAFISGSGSYAGLTLQVNQMKSAGILINYTNDGTCEYSLGWVNGAQVDVKTTVGTFTVSTGKSNQKITKNSTGAFSVDLGQELIGDVLSIVVRDINPLSASGLPSGSACTIEIPISDGNPTSPDSVATVTISGQCDFHGMQLTIDQKLSEGISVSYKNSEENAFSLGWAKKAGVQIKTSEAVIEGTVTQSSAKIEKGASGQFVIEASEKITGTVEEIVIYDVSTLSAAGLPNLFQSNLAITIPITQTES